MTAPVRVGLVGVGIIAETHLRVLAGIPEATLAFTVDPRLERPPPFRGRLVPHYPRLGDALTEQEADLVVLATPTPTHTDLLAEVLTSTDARVLVEKPLVHDLAGLDQALALDEQADLDGRVFVAHHFAFSPEVRWAADQVARHPDWGPVTAITTAFHDPYVDQGDHAFTSYVSSWTDSGINQLSMLARFVDFTGVTSRHEGDNGATAWATATYRSRGATGTARFRTSWLTGASSKRTTLTFAEAGVEAWLDHTAMTAFVAQGDTLLATCDDDGRTPRKLAHYGPLYRSLLTGAPDPVMGIGTAALVTRLLHSTPKPC